MSSPSASSRCSKRGNPSRSARATRPRRRSRPSTLGWRIKPATRASTNTSTTTSPSTTPARTSRAAVSASAAAANSTLIPQNSLFSLFISKYKISTCSSDFILCGFFWLLNLSFCF